MKLVSVACLALLSVAPFVASKPVCRPRIASSEPNVSAQPFNQANEEEEIVNQVNDQAAEQPKVADPEYSPPEQGETAPPAETEKAASQAPGHQESASAKGGMPLTFEEGAICSSDWKASRYSGKKQVSVLNENALKVTYPSGSYKSPGTGGFQFVASPIAENDEMTLRYSIDVPADFDFNKGGKLPGLKAGDMRSGGNQKGLGITGTSLRLMWRADGDMEVYAYAPIEEGGEVDSLPDCHVNTAYGTSLMRGRTKLIRGQKNDIVLYAKMNDPGKANGIVRLSVNGEEASMDIVTLRKTASLKLDGIFFSTFFGGGTADWATPREQALTFSSFSIE
ncbi:MAG: hypothetical protein SGCHY_003921 [Lobulomycetales sp.]